MRFRLCRQITSCSPRHSDGSRKQPYHIRLKDNQPFAFAGLWGKWHELQSCTILTTDANKLIGPLHDRMPVILGPEDYGHWLDPKAKDPGQLLTPFPAAEMVVVPVNPVVNNARNEGPECVEEVEGG